MKSTKHCRHKNELHGREHVERMRRDPSTFNPLGKRDIGRPSRWKGRFNFRTSKDGWVPGARLSLGVKRSWREGNRLPPSSAEVNGVELYLPSSIRLHGVMMKRRDNCTSPYRGTRFEVSSVRVGRRLIPDLCWLFNDSCACMLYIVE